MEPNVNLFDDKSIRDVKLQSKFLLIHQDSEIESSICIENRRRINITWKCTILRLLKDGKCQKFKNLDEGKKFNSICS